MINRIERPLANDHPEGSFSVHLFLHRPKTQNSRIIGQYTHNLLGLKTLSFALFLFIHKNMDSRSPNWIRHAKCTWSSCIENKWLLTLLFRTGSSLCLPEDLKRKGNFPNWVLFPNHLYSQVLKLPWQSSLWKYEIRHVHKLWKPIRLSILNWTISCITIKYHCSPVPLVPAVSDHKDILNCSLDLRAQ